MSIKSRGLLQNIFKSISVMVLLGGICFTLIIAGFLYFTLKDLPDISSLKEFRHSHATEVFSADGVKIGEFTKQRRYPVQFENIPKHVILAFLAAEDSRFYEHRGIDPGGIVRAILSNLMKRRYAQGGSTITQQVARSIVLGSRKKKIARKIREMVLAWRMEEELSKNEILALYLTEIYLGHGAFGIGAAARNYFGKKVEELDLAEASLLAGLPQRPNDWDPFHNPHLSKRRQEYVLNRMETEGFISHEQGLEALGKPLRLVALEDLNNKAAPYFTEFVRIYLMDKYGSEKILTSGFKVYTTLNYEFQKNAEKSINHGLREVDKRLGWRGVAIHLDSEIDVLAMAEKIHEDILKNLTHIRILSPVSDTEEHKLSYDLTDFQKEDSPYYGPTPIKEQEYYRAIISDVDEEKNEAYARIGDTFIVLPITHMEWIKQDKESKEPIKKVSEVLKSGDVVEVKIQKIDRKANLVEASLEQKPEIQGALLSMDLEEGFVRAMVGGKDFEESKFNCAIQAKRQVGSTFKPLVYAAAIDKGYSPSSMVTDSPIVFKYEGDLDADNYGEDWRPHNYGGKFKGEIPLRLALVRSMNIPTVKVLDQISVDYGIEYSRKLGISAVLPRDLSIGLGSWSSSLEEVMRAYAVFPRLGKPVKLNYIVKVVNLAGEIVEEFGQEEAGPGTDETTEPTESLAKVDGSLQHQFDTEEAPPSDESLPPGAVISPSTAYTMVDLLKAVVNEGTGWRAKALKRQAVAGKTGTSNDHRDAWFIGFIPQLMTGVWVGYEKDRPLESKETGGRAAAPIWVEYMKGIVDQFPRTPFPIPEGIVFAYVDRETGKLAQADNPNRVRVAFKVGTVPDREGENLPRIGEPGMKARLTTGAHDSEVEVLPKDSETSDYLRRGYQD